MVQLLEGGLVKVSLAFGQSWLSPNPSSAPADWTAMDWDDISQYVHTGELLRGRQRPADDWQSAAVSLVLNNKDGRFDSRLIHGPYSDGDGNSLCQLDTPIKIEIGPLDFGDGPTTYQRFVGTTGPFVAKRSKRAYASVPLKAWDMLAFLNRFPISGSFPRETVKDRCWRILDLAGWPAASVLSPFYRRTFGTDTGTMCAPIKFQRSTAGEELLRAVRTEGPNGHAHFDRLGCFSLTFRTGVFESPYTTPVATFSSLEHDKRYADITWNPDDRDYYNQASVATLTTDTKTVTVTTTVAVTAGESIIPVAELTGDIAQDACVDLGLGRVVTLSQPARAGDVSISTDPIPYDIPSGSVGVYSPWIAVVADNADQVLHGKRERPVWQICADDIDYARAMAEDMLAVSMDKSPKIQSISVNGRRSQDNAKAIADIALLSYATVNDVPWYAVLGPSESPSVLSLDMLTLGYHDTWSPKQWQTDFYMYPKQSRTVSIIGDAVSCVIGTTAKACF